MMGDRLRKAAIVGAALGQAMSPGWAYITGIGQPIWTRSDAVTTAATPATYAFGIWSFIFLTSLAYAIFAVRAAADDPLLRRIGWWSALAFALNAVWGVVQQVQGVIWLTVVLIFAIAAAAYRAFRPVAQADDLPASHVWLVALPLGVLAGWITVASPVNIDQALAFRHVAVPLSPTVAAVATLLASAGFVSLMLRPLRGHPIFVGAVVWALVGVAVANVVRQPDIVVAATAAGLAVALVISAWIVRASPARTTAVA